MKQNLQKRSDIEQSYRNAHFPIDMEEELSNLAVLHFVRIVRLEVTHS